LICGCMFSGKTTELLRRIRGEPLGATAVFKHHRDNRYATHEVVAHGRDGVAAVSVGQAGEIPSLVTPSHRMVAIDEGHLFDSALPQVCVALADRGLRVAVTSLDLNSWAKPFPSVEALRRVADECLVQSARCARCGREATRTQRITPIIDGNIIGGPDSFEPRCVSCWSPPPEESVD
jgi:thymidine kinase